MQAQLVSNRYTQVRYAMDKGEPILVVASCQRGLTPLYNTIYPSREPQLFSALERLATGPVVPGDFCSLVRAAKRPPRIRSASVTEQRLAELGLLVPRADLPRFRPFAALVGKQQKMQESVRGSLQDKLSVNPMLKFAQARKEACVRAWGKLFPEQEPPQAWVRDPGTRVFMPLWFVPQMLVKAKQLLAGKPSTQLSALERKALAAAGVLVSEQQLKARRALWEWLGNQGAAELKERGYLVIKGLLDPFQFASLQKYYGELKTSGFMPYVDDAKAKRFVCQNEPVTGFISKQLLPLMRTVTGEPLSTSDSAISNYQGLGFLPKHVDRENTHWTITLQMQFSPELQGPVSNPLLLWLPQGETPVFLENGDAVIYAGGCVPHGRPQLKEQESLTSAVFAYINKHRPV